MTSPQEARELLEECFDAVHRWEREAYLRHRIHVGNHISSSHRAEAGERTRDELHADLVEVYDAYTGRDDLRLPPAHRHYGKPTTYQDHASAAWMVVRQSTDEVEFEIAFDLADYRALLGGSSRVGGWLGSAAGTAHGGPTPPSDRP